MMNNHLSFFMFRHDEEREIMDLKRQASAPLYEAIETFRKKRIVPFDVPGHKRGRGNPELVDLLGERCVGIDVNSMKPLDNLCHPVSVIKEAQELTAEAFGAEAQHRQYRIWFYLYVKQVMKLLYLEMCIRV